MRASWMWTAPMYGCASPARNVGSAVIAPEDAGRHQRVEHAAGVFDGHGQADRGEREASRTQAQRADPAVGGGRPCRRASTFGVRGGLRSATEERRRLYRHVGFHQAENRQVNLEPTLTPAPKATVPTATGTSQWRFFSGVVGGDGTWSSGVWRSTFGRVVVVIRGPPSSGCDWLPCPTPSSRWEPARTGTVRDVREFTFGGGFRRRGRTRLGHRFPAPWRGQLLPAPDTPPFPRPSGPRGGRRPTMPRSALTDMSVNGRCGAAGSAGEALPQRMT